MTVRKHHSPEATIFDGKYYHCILRTIYLLHVFIIIIFHKCADDSMKQGNAYIDFDFFISFELPQYLLWPLLITCNCNYFILHNFMGNPIKLIQTKLQKGHILSSALVKMEC